MKEFANGVADGVELLAGMFQVAVNVSSFQAQIKKIKPEINQRLGSNTGVLLVMRTETVRGILNETSHISGIYIAGAGAYPEPILSKWQQQPSLFPKTHWHASVSETYIWVIRNKDVNKFLHRPPGYYMPVKEEIKYSPFEML